MSRKTTVNRKFLEEQVRKTLLEFDPEEIGRNPKPEEEEEEEEDLGNTDKFPGEEGFGAVNLDSLEYSEPVVPGEDTLGIWVMKLGVGAAKEIIDVPVLFYKKLERHIEFDGSFHRQTLKRAKIKSDIVREFFSLYLPATGMTSSIAKFRYGWDKFLDEDSFTIHPELKEMIEKWRKTRDWKPNRENLYLSLRKFFRVTKSRDLILSDHEKIMKNVENTEISFDEFLISCFKRSDSDFMSVKYKDVYDFLSQVKEEIIDEMKEDYPRSPREALVYVVISEVDPQESDKFKQFDKYTYSQLKKDPDLNPWNLVRGFGLMWVGNQIEKYVYKRPLTFWRSLLVGFGVALALDWGDQNLRGNWIPTTYGEIEDISNYLKEAENLIRTAGRYGGASEKITEEIRELILKAVDMVRTQFREKMESEGLMMSMEDKVGAFDQLSLQLDRTREIFDPSNFYITKDNYEEQAKKLQYFRNGIVEIYKKYRVSLAEFSPLEEHLEKQIEEISEKYDHLLIKEENINEKNMRQRTIIRDISFSNLEIKMSKLTEEDIEALIIMYGITPDNVYSKLQTMQGFPALAKKALGRGARSMGRFKVDFKKEAENMRRKYRMKALRNVHGSDDLVNMKNPSSYENEEDLPGQSWTEEFLQYQLFLKDNYFEKLKDYQANGMYYKFIGRGGLVRDGRVLCSIFAPYLSYNDDENKDAVHHLTGYPSKDRDKVGQYFYGASFGKNSQEYKYVKAAVSNRRNDVCLKAPFGDIMGNQLGTWPGAPGNVTARTKLKNASKYLYQKGITDKGKDTGYGGNLRAILAIHDIYWKVVGMYIQLALRAEQSALNSLYQADDHPPVGEIATLFKWLYGWGELEYFTYQNKISFFRTKHEF